MKKKQGLLVMLLGCLVTVTAVAGVLVWQGTGKEKEESREYVESEGSSEQLLWNDETTGTKESTDETVKETKESRAALLPETEAAVRETKETEQEQMELPSEAPAAAEEVHSVSFDSESRLLWPVEGSVLMEYSMDRTVYFPTLDEYKCSPAVLIQGEAGMPVKAPADAVVKEVGQNEELGNYMILDAGNGYELTCGQLAEPALAAGDYVEAGGEIGALAEPTKYYVVEGTNLYFGMTKDGEPVDPLDYME